MTKALLHNLTLEKWRLIKDVACQLDIPALNLATVIAFETSESFSPGAVNPYSKAIGLIQFTKEGYKAIKDYGYSYDAIGRMDFEQQLRGPVVDYLTEWDMLGETDLASLYMSIFAPAKRYREGTHKVYIAPSKRYEQNKGLDKEKKGYITKNDAAEAVFQMCKKVVKRINQLEVRK